MNALTDLTLAPPIGERVIHGLLFGTFTLHLLFVLMMLGTAILGMWFFLHAWWGRRLGELRFDKQVLRMFLVTKSLAVVLGVGPLLLIQVGFTVPFFTAVTFFAPLWMLIIALLIASFLSFDSLAHRVETHPYVHLAVGTFALGTLLIVPGFFVAVLVTAENSDKWLDMLHLGFNFDWRLSVHWLLRYLHVLGAAVVFGAAFHYFFIADARDRKSSLMKWILGGLLFQVLVGFALYFSLLIPMTLTIYLYLIAGVALALAAIVWVAVRLRSAAMSFYGVLPLGVALLTAMLLTRQALQDRAFYSLRARTQPNTDRYRAELAGYRGDSLRRYERHTAITYDNGPTIYRYSCSFCHGADGKGDGPDAAQLRVPPEHIRAVRTTPAYLRHILMNGVDGSAMPRFGYYDPAQRERIAAYLDDRWSVLASPGGPPVILPESAVRQAETIWGGTCAQCHGADGRGGPAASRLMPPPPDLTRYSLTPDRTLEVVTHGYPATAMPAFGSFSLAVRWGLVQVVLGKRIPAGK